MDKLDPSVYAKPADETIEKLLTLKSFSDKKSILVGLKQTELRWVTKNFNLNLKKTKIEMVQNTYSYLVTRARAALAFSCFDDRFAEDSAGAKMDAEDAVADLSQPAHCFAAAELVDHYELLKRYLDQDQSDDVELSPGHHLYTVLERLVDPEHPPSRIRVYRKRSRILVGDTKHTHEILSVLPSTVSSKKEKDVCSKSSIVVDFYYKKSSAPPRKAKQGGSGASIEIGPNGDKKVKLHLPPEQLSKGFVELPYEWFEENNLVEELKEALGKLCRSLVYKVESAPADVKQIMTSRVIIGVKIDSKGYLKKVKARYVPRGFSNNDYRSLYLRRDTEMCTQEGLHLALQKFLNEEWLLGSDDFAD